MGINFKPGDYIELPRADRAGTLAGLVEATWVERGRRYVTLYSFAARTTRTYRLDRRGRVRKERPRPETGEASTPSEERDGAAAGGTGRGLASMIVLIGAILLAVFIVLPLLQGGYGRVRVSFISYERFLEREMNLGPLVSTVARRISYRPEPDDYWSAPDDAWAARSGDCEDHAMVVSAYLSRHNIDHTLLGLSLKSGLEGHVVVVVTGEDGPILLDPTGATAESGIERFSPGTTLRDVAAKYATLPAQRYGETVAPGDPDPVGIVE